MAGGRAGGTQGDMEGSHRSHRGLSRGDPPGFCVGDGREAVAGDRKSPTEEEKAELSHRAVGVMAVAIILIH